MSNSSKLKFLIVVLVLLTIVGGLSGDDPQVEDEQTNNSIPTNANDIEKEPRALTAEEQRLQDFKEVESGVYDVSVYNDTLYIYMNGTYDAISGDVGFMHRTNIRSMFEIMNLVSEKNFNASSIKITGYVPMQDMSGNTRHSPVFSASRSMDGIESINWKNLKSYENLDGVMYYNFDKVWWHPEFQY